jgi:very-short-patch-repair endonuclease
VRHRLVTEQDGKQHVSGVLLMDDEIDGMLNIEERLHEAAGWDVTRYGTMMRLTKGTAVRWVWVRSRPALEDET